MFAQTGCDDSSKKKKEANAQVEVDSSGKEKDKESLKTNEKSGEDAKQAEEKEVSAEPKQKTEVTDSTATTNVGEQKETGDEKKAAATESKDGKVAAVFTGGSIISQDEVLKRIQLLPEKIQKLPFTQLYNLVLFVMIQEKLAYKTAIEKGFDKKESVKKQMDSIKESIIHQYYLEEKASKFVTDEAMEKQYHDLIKNFKSEEEIGIRHILVKTKVEADGIITKLKAGESFEELQQVKTIDKKTLEKKGFLGFFKKSQLPPQDSEIILKTEVNHFVSAPIEVPNAGYSVLFITEKRQSKPKTLEKVKDQIKAILIKKGSLEHIEELYKKYGVVCLDPEGKPIPRKSVNERLEEIRLKQEGKQSVEEESKKEESINKITDSSVVAKMGKDISITFAEVSDFIKDNSGMFRGMSPWEVFTLSVEECVNKRVLCLVTKENGFVDNPETLKKVEEAAHSLLSQKFLASEASALITNEVLQESYNKFVADVDKDGLEIRLKAIPVESKEKGEEVIKALKAGENFDAVLEKYCSDPRFKEKKGDLGYLRKEQITAISPELANAVIKAPKATLLPTLISVGGQMLVVRIEDKRKTEVPPFSQIKEQLKQRLIPDHMVKVTLDLMKKDGVKAFDFNGSSISLNEKDLEKALGGTANIAL
ncbi:MAG: peptidyl-prolyl cis-trans isomerase [Holosporales bacterium]|nr:peptidyl-prolyl cis-trans isomerase [Holosporales bacterium]